MIEAPIYRSPAGDVPLVDSEGWLRTPGEVWREINKQIAALPASDRPAAVLAVSGPKCSPWRTPLLIGDSR